LVLVIHWQGGDHTELTVKKNKIGQTRWTVEADVVDLVRMLARQLPDLAIATILNRSGKLTGRGSSWTASGRTTASPSIEKGNGPNAARRPSMKLPPF
jgi:hypothetical protein